MDGTVEQDESVGQMVFAVPELIEFLSSGHTIAGIGTLSNPVVEEA